MVWYFYLFKNFPQFIVTYTVKGFNIVNEAEVDVVEWKDFACLDICFLLPAHRSFIYTQSKTFKSVVHIFFTSYLSPVETGCYLHSILETALTKF